jgi:prophage regulatory protein
MAEQYSKHSAMERLVAERHLRRPAVETATGLSRSSIYAMMDTDDFPRPVRIGKRAVAWPESAVTAWLASRPSADRVG